MYCGCCFVVVGLLLLGCRFVVSMIMVCCGRVFVVGVVVLLLPCCSGY